MSTEYKKSNGNGKCPVIHGALTVNLIKKFTQLQE